MAETALIITAAVGSATMAVMQGMQASAAASQQSAAAKHNATVLDDQGKAETNAAGANEGMALRKSAVEMGQQAAAFGEANTGTGGSAQDVERQSRTMSRMDALNIWYGGELARHQADSASQAELYNSKIYSANAKAEMLKGYMGAGTQLLMGGARAVGGDGGGSAPWDFTSGVPR